MGCIQSYFRKAAAASSQASPIDVDKQFIDFEKKNVVEPKAEKVPIVSEEDISPVNDDDEENDDENAEKGSIHCVEATAVRTLAASTGTVAILGTTAKYNEKVDYRRSLHEDSTTFESKIEQSAETEKVEIVNDQKPVQEEKSQITQNGPTSIVTTAIIEARPTANENEKIEPEQEIEVNGETKPNESNQSSSNSVETAADVPKPEEPVEFEKYLPKVVQSIEKTKKDSFDKKEEPLKSAPPELPKLQLTEIIEIKSNELQATPKQSETELTNEAPPATVLITETAQDTEIPSPSIVETEDRENNEHEKTNENSEVESTSSDIVSVVNEAYKEPPQKNDSFEECQRPNRLSLGQMSLDESEQNTLEISSADDVMKNESTDLTSPESLKESFEESLPKMNILVEGKAESKDDGGSSKEENAREISNTSLNTLGDDSEDDGSDLEGNVSRKNEHAGMRRFDTISSNGESSYNRVEDQNYPSVTEAPDLEEMVDQKLLELDLTQEDNVFDTEELKKLKKSVRETVVQEVDDICKQAVEKTNDIMAKIAADSAVVVEQKDNEEVNNESESSVLSAMDSVVAEKGSDFDSLSFLDEQSDSRSLSAPGQEDGKGVKAEIQEIAAASVSSADDAQKRLQEWEQIPSGVQEEVSNLSKEVAGAVITQEDISKESEKITVDSVSEDLPKPPDLEEFPPLPENLDQFDVTEEELKAVRLPGSAENVSQSESKDSPDPEIAASKIQAGVRGYLTRKQIKERNGQIDIQLDPSKTDLDAIDGISKDYNIQKKRMSLDSKLVDIENIRKLPKLRCTLSECVEEESENLDLDKAASKIQTTFRNYRARKSICLGDSKKIFNGQSTITSKIIEDTESNEKTGQSSQETVNGKVETIPENPIEEDQKPSNEQEISTQMGSNRMAVKTFDDDPVKQAAVKIQATYRGFKTRKSIQISASAATKIQAHFRGYKVRKTIKRSSSLNDLRNSASSSCSNISSQQDLEKRVTKIQAGVRGYLARKRHSLQHSAAAKIQMNYRRYKSRKETKSRPVDQ